MQYKTSLSPEEMKKIKEILKKQKKFMTLKDFIDLMRGTIITDERFYIAVGENCIKFRIGCED